MVFEPTLANRQDKPFSTPPFLKLIAKEKGEQKFSTQIDFLEN